MFGRPTQPNLAVDLLIGLGSGLVASWVMERTLARLSKLESPAMRAKENAASGLKPATVKAATATLKPFGIHIPKRRERLASEIVHYVYGAGWGAAFVLASRRSRLPSALQGVLFGAALWLISDEVLVPLFGFAKKPTAYPAATHLKALAAHVVYGATTAETHHLARRLANGA